MVAALIYQAQVRVQICKWLLRTLAWPVAQLTEIALGPAMVRWIWEGSSPVVLSAAMPVVRGRKSVAGLREVSHGWV